MNTLHHAGAVLLLLAAVLSDGQRPGGEIRQRTDERKAIYYEVFADARNGEHGGPVPMRNTGQGPTWPRSVSIRGESTWAIRKTPHEFIDANGTKESCSDCPVPTAPAGVLLARWVTLDMTNRLALLRPSPVPVTFWTAVGKAATLAVPIPPVSPKPYTPSGTPAIAGLTIGPELHYTPLLGLQYRINDGDISDNDGWLHVYQDWIW